MKYLRPEPMVFTPPQKQFGEDALMVNDSDIPKCNHRGCKQIFVHNRWECGNCGEVIE